MKYAYTCPRCDTYHTDGTLSHRSVCFCGLSLSLKSSIRSDDSQSHTIRLGKYSIIFNASKNTTEIYFNRLSIVNMSKDRVILKSIRYTITEDQIDRLLLLR